MFKEGSDPKAGSTPNQIDEAPYAAACNSAKAHQAKAEANLAQQTQAQLERYRPLVAANAISKRDFVNAEAAVKQSPGRRSPTKAAVRTRWHQPGLRHGHSTDFSGRIGPRLVTEGALVGGEATTWLSSKIRPRLQLPPAANDILQLRKAMASGQLERRGQRPQRACA